MADKDFFLSSDDAQTMGDINYMRKSVRVRRTFAKSLKNPDGFAVEKETSSSKGRSLNDFSSNANETSSNSLNAEPVQNTNANFNSEPLKNTPKKRPQGSSMDMFRNMARNIGKK